MTDSGGQGTIRNALLAALPPSELVGLEALFAPVHLHVGQVLFDVGELVERVYFPETCMVTLSTPMECGREIANTMRGRQGAIGYLEAISSGISLSRAVVQIEGDAHFLTAQRFREAYEASPGLRNLSRRRIQILLADARQSVACQASHTAPERLARMLLECCEHTGSTRLRLTHELIGDLTGLGRTTISHTAAALRDRGLIDSQRGEIRLLDFDGLKSTACECYHALQQARRLVLSSASSVPDQGGSQFDRRQKLS